MRSKPQHRVKGARARTWKHPRARAYTCNYIRNITSPLEIIGSSTCAHVEMGCYHAPEAGEWCGISIKQVLLMDSWQPSQVQYFLHDEAANTRVWTTTNAGIDVVDRRCAFRGSLIWRKIVCAWFGVVFFAPACCAQSIGVST